MFTAAAAAPAWHAAAGLPADPAVRTREQTAKQSEIANAVDPLRGSSAVCLHRVATLSGMPVTFCASTTCGRWPASRCFFMCRATCAVAHFSYRVSCNGPQCVATWCHVILCVQQLKLCQHCMQPLIEQQILLLVEHDKHWQTEVSMQRFTVRPR